MFGTIRLAFSPRAGSPRPYHRPTLECLEDRSLLSANVLQTNLVSDLPGVAAVTDPNLTNPWGITESATSPFWISDNNSGLSTLYNVPGANNTPVSINPLAVSIPAPGDPAGSAGTPTGTVFNIAQASGAFKVTGLNKAGQTVSLPAVFLFATEDGTIVGWNPGIDPTGKFDGPNGVSTHAVIIKDFSTTPSAADGAVYKGLTIATDANGKTLLYAANFRSGQIDVFDANFDKVTSLPPGAFTDPNLPKGYAPFDVQELNGKIYVTYALQNDTKHDDVAGPHHGFVDVFNLNGTPGVTKPDGSLTQRLITRGELDSPWDLAIAPAGFAGIKAANNDPVLLVGNFGNGFIHAYDASTGKFLGTLNDPDGEPIQIDGLWALKVGNDNGGGASDTVYFTAGLFGETHGLFGSLKTAAPGSPEGQAEAQMIQADLDVVQINLKTVLNDISSGASQSQLRQDIKTLDALLAQLVRDESRFARDTRLDGTQHNGRSADDSGLDDLFSHFSLSDADHRADEGGRQTGHEALKNNIDSHGQSVLARKAATKD
jgi:uncharacterized protein (TIGR03118 family)